MILEVDVPSSMREPNDTDLIAERAANILLVRFLVFGQGLLTVFLSLVFYPLGALLGLANGVMALYSSGVNRKMFIAFATASGVICLGIWLLLTPFGTSTE